MTFTAYLAPDGFTEKLVDELGGAREIHGRLVIAEGPPKKPIWAENIWLEPQMIQIESIGDAARKLKAIQRNWANYAFDFHRRSELITEKLPHVSAKPLKFPNLPPQAPLGSWCLIREDMMIASAKCSEPVPNGAYLFQEDKVGPPSRAYLKLWEALTRCGKMPKPDETCLDLGAAPGGWTWALNSLAVNVIAVDKAPLAPNVAKLPRVRYVEQSAFALTPADVGPVDWLFSDIICYPERLLRLVNMWRETGQVRNFVTTIKFQGDTDLSAVKPFLDIEGSFAFHLYNNKHEITWFKLEQNP
ncbi:MAG: SAM-dependent methyltransferase [Alphaproteobacteria bacterium]